MPVKEKLCDRTKPELPHELDKFRIIYNTLAIPYGPKYIGNYEFEEQRLTSEQITFIKENQTEYDPVEMTRFLVQTENVFVRAEAVANYYNKKDTNKFWKGFVKSAYLIHFEKENKVRKKGEWKLKSGNKILPEQFYKSFIIWLIEHNYEYFQIGKALGYAPGTVRRWGNDYGYKEYSTVRSRQPDTTGKHSRVEGKEVEQLPLEFSEVQSIPAQNQLLLPRDVGTTMKLADFKHQWHEQQLNRSPTQIQSLEEKIKRQDEFIAAYTDIITKAVRTGHKITITLTSE